MKKRALSLCIFFTLVSLSVFSQQTYDNIVIFVASPNPDGSMPLALKNRAYYDKLLNDESNISMKKYYQDISYNQLIINSETFPRKANFYIDTQTIDQLKSFNELANRAVKSVLSEIPFNLKLDNDNDGVIDFGITFIWYFDISATNLSVKDSWHLGDIDTKINGKIVKGYTTIHNDCPLGTLAHEFFHGIGAFDLYRGCGTTIGSWDILDASNEDLPPQTNTYIKYRYGKWIPVLPEISESGYFYLSPSSASSNNTYRIPSAKANEYFVIEYRKKEGYDLNIPSNGLLIYRINPSRQGNLKSDTDCESYTNYQTVLEPDEVYLYQPDGNYFNSGNAELWEDAHFSKLDDRTTFSANSNPNTWLSDGCIEQSFSITEISEPGRFMSFKVTFDDKTVTGYPISNTSAGRYITTQGDVKIQNNKNINFSAGHAVMLNPGFEVEKGATFTIDINGCGNQ